MIRLDKKTAIVTGAGRGIGRAISEIFAKEGARVYALDTSPCGESCSSHNGRIVSIFCDVSDPESINRAFVGIKGEVNTIDVLVNNAAVVTERGLITDVSLEQWNKEFSVSVTGAFLMTSSVLPMMKSGASIINLASTYAHVGGPNLAIYSATKGALLAITRSLALDYARDGIRFNSISPGPIVTERLLHQYGDRQKIETAFADRVPLGRLGEAEEIGEAAVYLASSKSSFITGADIRIDGGYCAR